MLPLLVLADATILVKDVVSFVFFDLAKAGALDLRWTPRIELECARGSVQQFDNQELATELAERWGLQLPPGQ